MVRGEYHRLPRKYRLDIVAELEPIEPVLGADTDEAGVESAHNVESSSPSYSSSHFARPMQVQLSEFIAVAGGWI